MTARAMSSQLPPTDQETSNETHLPQRGSGLAVFFWDFLPNAASGNDEQAKIPTNYSTSLSEIPPTTREFVQESERSRGIHTDDDSYQMTYREWRNEQKQILMDFLVKRLTDVPSGDEHAEDTSEEGQQQGGGYEDANDYMFQTQPETQPMFETQPETQAMFEPSTEEHQSPTERPKKRQKRAGQKAVPHVDETLHDVSKLEYLDLYTQTLSLSLCRVIKVWRKRDNKRGGVGPLQQVAKCCPKFPHHMEAMPRIPFGDMEEDGPLASAFRTVLSMEVEQLKLAESNAVSSSSFHASKQRLRIKLFFYNAYAEKVGEWLDGQRKKKHSNFVLALSHVPAHCIFPRAIDPHNWTERQNMVDYCVCIGDTSSAKTIANGAFIRFDDKALQVNMASQSVSGNQADGGEALHLSDELVLSQKNCDEGYFLSSSSESDVGLRDIQHVLSIQDAWTRYIHQKRSDLEGGNPSRQSQNSSNSNVGNSDMGESGGQGSSGDELLRDELHQVASITFLGSAKREQNTNDVEYVKLADLRGILDRNKEEGIKKSFVNIYGVVLGFTSPSQTRRGDWMMTAVLVDESCATPVTVVMFGKGPASLPKLLWMGDVLRMHRVEPQLWGNEVQILAMKFKSSFVVVRNTPEHGWTGLSSALNSFTFKQSDEMRSQLLWKWGQNFIRDSPTINKEHSFTLAEMAAMNNEEEDMLKDRDITVMVTGVYPYPQHPSGITPRGMMRIWDGTGIPPSDPFPVRTLFSQQAESIGDPPPEALERFVKMVQELRLSSDDMIVPLSFCGRVANVLIWEEAHWELLKDNVQPGTFCRLRNVDIRRWQYNQFRSLMVHSKTWLTLLPTSNFEVRELIKAHNHRVTCGDYNPKAGILPSSSDAGRSQSSMTGSDHDQSDTSTGLKEFVDQADLGVYTGRVTVKVVPESLTRSQLLQKLEHRTGPRTPVIFTIKDESVSVLALASETIRRKLHQLLSDSSNGEEIWEEISNPKKTYAATMRSVDWSSQRYFVLNDLLPMEADG